MKLGERGCSRTSPTFAKRGGGVRQQLAFDAVLGGKGAPSPETAKNE